ncbi:MAG: hypothetical protein JRK53_09290 [Deltaproteobacteria bacterium]|nr:hypothetical protein [Deltaproteobacteria bacterium]
MKIRESRLSAHHNYLVNRMLTPGFLVGDARSGKKFYFLADLVLPGESTPRISCRLMNERGGVLVEIGWNRIRENPGGCLLSSVTGGFRIHSPANDLIMEVRTESFANGYLTRIKARLFDEKGELRMAPMEESIEVHGEAELALTSSFDPFAA